MTTSPFAVPAAAPAGRDIKKIIRDAYETRKRAKQAFEQLRIAGEEITRHKADAWASDVASRGVDLNAVIATHETTKKELEAQEKKMEAVKSLMELVELRIKQLKTTNGAEVVEVLKEQIALLQKAKTNDEKSVEAADHAIDSLWKEVQELDSYKAPATGAKKK